MVIEWSSYHFIMNGHLWVLINSIYLSDWTGHLFPVNIFPLSLSLLLSPLSFQIRSVYTWQKTKNRLRLDIYTKSTGQKPSVSFSSNPLCHPSVPPCLPFLVKRLSTIFVFLYLWTNFETLFNICFVLNLAFDFFSLNYFQANFEILLNSILTRELPNWEKKELTLLTER